MKDKQILKYNQAVSNAELDVIVQSQMTAYFGSPPPDDDYHDFITTVGTIRRLCQECVVAGILYHAAAIAAKDKK